MSDFYNEVRTMTEKAKLSIDHERENLENEFFKTIEFYIPELLSLIKKKITNAAKKGDRHVSIEFSKFYIEKDLHNKLSKFNDIFEDILPINQHLNRLGLNYIKSNVETIFNYHFYIPKLINILTGNVEGEPKFILKYRDTLDEQPPLKGFTVNFSDTGYLPETQRLTTNYYAVKFFW